MKFVLILLALGAVMYLVNQYKNSSSAKENIQLGEAFLAKNSSLDGVQTTASGLQYKVLETGSGTTHPTATDRVKVHYHGTLIDGTVFDSSVDRNEPISFGLSQVISGWTEGLQLMVVGEKTRFFIPNTLAYGNRAAGKIKPGSTLIFDVELIGINAD
ncbi:MAG: FKBP-type peptidyl-prolyl cis-trans isomerase [Granulosicoccus sp.]|nr:FKBP-type peptidyl-prolyl cis-trans isomerase [Granulosicoccus sp.]